MAAFKLVFIIGTIGTIASTRTGFDQSAIKQLKNMYRDANKNCDDLTVMGQVKHNDPMFGEKCESTETEESKLITEIFSTQIPKITRAFWFSNLFKGVCLKFASLNHHVQRLKKTNKFPSVPLGASQVQLIQEGGKRGVYFIKWHGGKIEFTTVHINSKELKFMVLMDTNDTTDPSNKDKLDFVIMFTCKNKRQLEEWQNVFEKAPRIQMIKH